SHLMRKFATGQTAWAQRVHDWIEANRALEEYILAEIKRNGPMLSRQFEKEARAGWKSSGWTNERNVSRMLDFLWTKGVLVVAGRSGGQKMWDVAERFLPDWTPREVLPEREVVRLSTQQSLRALGVARPNQIKLHFMPYS